MRIIIKEKGRQARTVHVPREPFTLGRSRQADVQLDNYYASGKHCVLKYEGALLTIVDLGSTNGTFLNGEKVEESALNPGDRLLVGTALVLITADDQTPELEQLAKQYEEGEVETRDQVIGMLGALGAPEGVDLLRRALSDESPTVRESAAASLGAIGATGAGKELVACLADEDDAVRRRAKWALIRTADPDAADELVETISRGEPEARLAAIHISGMLRIKKAGVVVVQAMGAEQYRIREAAVRALGAFRDQDALPHLLAALDQPDRYPVARIIEALGALAHPSALPELVVHLTNEAVEVRESAAHALGQVWSRQTVVHLIGALQDESASVRRTASASLERIRRTMEPLTNPGTAKKAATLHLSDFGAGGTLELSESTEKKPLTLQEDTQYWQEWWDDMQKRLPRERG